MIQRKQTVFLILAAIVEIITLCLPLGILKPTKLGVDSVVYSLLIQNGNGCIDITPIPLFIVLAVSIVISVATIFLYNKRKLQIKLCSWNMLLVLVWYIVYGVVVYIETDSYNATLKVGFAAILPLVALILIFMARKGVKADEALIRAAERIR